MENITTILPQIEKEYGVKILYACETGSRAWGFPSPDSDYDIRFLYMHEKDWYLSLNERKDTIEFMLNEELDITGWDIKKSLILLKKSNAPLIERFQSPIEYYAADGFKENFKKLIQEYYSPVAVFYHHHSLAKKFLEDIKDQDSFKLKQYFYFIRSLLSSNWIIQDNNVLPMHIEGLMQLIDEERKQQLRKLILLKVSVGEKFLYSKETHLHSWLMELWDTIDATKENLKTNSNSYTALNDFFIQTINESANNRLG
jgi:predicted nucleotidyltransferase